MVLFLWRGSWVLYIFIAYFIFITLRGAGICGLCVKFVSALVPADALCAQVEALLRSRARWLLFEHCVALALRF